MISSTSRSGMAGVQANERMEAVNSPQTNGGASGAGGYLPGQTDAKESATAPQFGDVYKQIQAKYGEKPEKPREVKKTLGKDDFLRIMLTQMKNQDPTNPFKAEQMATEIAQFTSVEQLQNVNQNLNRLSTQNRPLEQMAMTQLIGKVVTIDRQRFPHTEGQNDSLDFNLAREASHVQVVVINDGGEELIRKDLGAQKAGPVSFTWDGVKSNTLPAKGGNYRFIVEAKDSTEKPIEVNSQSQKRILGVSFEGTEPVFLVGDSKRPEKITLKNIVRVDTEAGVGSGSPALGTTSATPQAPAMDTSRMFAFQKGVGSMPLEMAPPIPPPAQTLPRSPNVPQEQAPQQALQEQVLLEKGFPNGLHDGDERGATP